MLFFIAINTIQIAIENPLNDPNTLLSSVLNVVDYILTAIFALEVIIKIIANGVYFCGEQSYLRNYLNLLDMSVVIISVEVS
jgi:hypothetical protein